MCLCAAAQTHSYSKCAAAAMSAAATNRGCVHLIIGPMFSGKTSELIRRVQRHRQARRRCLVIKYAEDTRYDARAVCTHDMRTYKAIPGLRLMDFFDQIVSEGVDVVGVDEAQFFEQDDLHTFVTTLADLGKIVVVAGLDARFDKAPFESICTLVSACEWVTKLTAVCSECGGDASFTKRIGDCAEVKLIGGSEVYKPVCRRCYSLA